MSAPLVALVHGLEDGCESWRPLMRVAGDSARFAPLRLPWSAGNDYRWRRRGTPARWLAAALAELDEAPRVLVGHSFGANAILELRAGGDGPRVPTVLMAPLFLPDDVAVTWSLFDRSRAAFDDQIRDGVRARLGPRASRVSPELLDSMVGKTLDRIGPAGFLAVFEQYIATGHLDLGDLGTPVLVLAGADDPTLGERNAAAIARRLPGARVVRLPAQDHFGHLRDPAAVWSEIAPFVSTTTPPARMRSAPGPIVRSARR